MQGKPYAVMAALAVATAIPTVAHASPDRPVTATTTSPAKAAAGWLARQLAGAKNDHYTVSFGGQSYVDDGLTADGLLGMDAAHVAQAAAERMTARLQADAKSYAGTAPNYYPGSLAKLLLVAEAQHVDVHSFGGIDLVAALRGEENAQGLYDDPDQTNGYDSPVTQAFALIALSHTGAAADKPDRRAIRWLVGQQCRDGGFSSVTSASPPATCTDVDATAYAAQALLTVGSAAAPDALAWLNKHTNPDGGFGLDTNGKASSNGNSTAVAVQALLQAGRNAASARKWLVRHQLGCTADSARRGSVRFDQSRWNHATALRATTQAAQALAGRWLGHISNTDASTAEPRLRCAG